MKKGQLTQNHINDYVLFQFDGLLKTLGEFNYPSVYSLVSQTRNEFTRQSRERAKLQQKYSEKDM